ncbi:MAG: AbrB/MazE/SpoVT family DNA-binding domain-containing protein [Candidatus Diapherotrites archaeon]|nr:AbrB/MazE/SpoVT family DNA-binding domain-containing protein [Candidatus Diapherotrites archaeon]
MNCPLCEGKLVRVKEPYSYGDLKLGVFEADKCAKCHEAFFTEEASDKIDAKAKQLGVWGLGKEGKLGYSGNSLIVRVPKEIAKFLELKEGKKVFIHPEGKKKLVVETD